MNICPICEKGQLQNHTYVREMVHKGISILVEGLQYAACPSCGAEVTSPEQLDLNAARIREAFISARERTKRELGLLTGTEIRQVREELGITQKQASKLFGGGPTAFAKYEAEDVVQSVAMDNLLRVAAAVPEAANWLFSHAGEAMTAPMTANLGRIPNFIIRNIGTPNTLPTQFIEEQQTKAGRFDLSLAECCNDGEYADAA